MSDWLVGIDIGGTFTDLYAREESADGRELSLKVPTTPSEPAKGLMNALRAAAAQLGEPLEELLARVRYLGHASTISTNLIVERKGAETGLLVTAGFPDSLALQRLNMGRLTFDLQFDRPTALVDRRRVREVPERIDRDGRVLRELDEEAILRGAAELVEQGVDAIAIAFLWSFRNPAHEQRAAELLRSELGDLWISLSHEVVPLSGEYERTSTTVIDAYIGRRVSTYLRAVAADLGEAGLRREIFAMQTVGGTAPIEHLAGRPVRTLNSGPVAGAAGAAIVGSEIGRERLIAGDVGGTSFDVSVVVDGAPLRSQGVNVLGLHTLISTVDVNAIGAGGGSIARLAGGHLRVGPHSAGSDPGPACYGRGGSEPTVTDALVELGVIDTEAGLAAGTFGLDSAAARRAISERLSGPLGVSDEDAALAVYEVANAHMADAIRVSTVRRGYDPGEFSLILFGGAGPAHGWAIAAELGIPEIIVPAAGSVLSAYGLVSSDAVFEEVLSRRLTAPFDGETVAALLAELGERAGATARAAGMDDDGGLRYSVDVRYEGQLSDLAIEVEPAWLGRPGELEARIGRSFAARYDDVFGAGTHVDSAPVRLSRFRAELIPELLRAERHPAPEGDVAAEPTDERPVTLSERHRGTLCPVYSWPELAAGSAVEGPALVASPLTTCVVGPGQSARVDGFGNVRIELGGRHG